RLAIAIACATVPMMVNHAQPLDQAALQAITDTADRICDTIKTEGSSSDVTAKGEITAQVSELLKKLADIGVSGTGAYTANSYVGVLQKDLPQLVEASSECKYKVFSKLVDLMTSNNSSQAAVEIAKSWPTNTGAYPIDRIGNSLNSLLQKYSEDQISSKLSSIFI